MQHLEKMLSPMPDTFPFPGELPALMGGTPVRPEGPPSWPFADADVASAIATSVADGSWGQYLGEHVPRLEAMITEMHGVSHAVTCATGTLAVEIGLRALGVGPGDEVILAAYDFEPTFVSIHAIGAIPVLVDVVANGSTIDPDRIMPAITPRTKAIIATHLHGGLARMSSITELGRNRGVGVIEDAAQGDWRDRGRQACRILGGYRRPELRRIEARDLRSRRRDPDFASRDCAASRWCGAFSRHPATRPAQRASGRRSAPQLLKLPERSAHRARMVERLNAMFADIPGLRSVADTASLRPAFYKLGYLLDEQAFGLGRDRFVAALRAEGIAFDAGFRALHVGRSPSRYNAVGLLDHAEIAGRCMVTLHHPVLSLGFAEIEQVAAAVWKTYRNANRLR